MIQDHCPVEMRYEGRSENHERTPLLQTASHSGILPRNNVVKILERAVIFVLFLVLISGIAIAVFLLAVEGGTAHPDKQLFVPRASWLAITAPSDLTGLVRPLEEVTLAQIHNISTLNLVSCSSSTKRLSSRRKRENEILRFNFVVDLDGRMYEGKGWNSCRGDRDDVFVIAFVGTDNDCQFIPKQIENLAIFLDESVTDNKLIPCFRILRGANQQTDCTIDPFLLSRTDHRKNC